MAASYPGAVATTPTRDDADMSATTSHKTNHDRIWEEIRAIEQTLGANPQGSFGTVLKRVSPIGAVCQVTQSTMNIADSTPTLVTFGGESLDPLSWHSIVTNNTRVTPTIAGWYRATFSCLFSDDADYVRLFAHFFKNGSGTNIRSDLTDSGGTLVRAAISIASPLIQLNGSSDYLEVSVLQTNTSGNAESVESSFFLVELVYPT